MPFVRHLLIFEMRLTIQNPGIAEFRLIMLLLFSSCWSHVGKTGLKQPISLAPDCWFYGIVVHEIGGLVIFLLRYKPISKRKSTPIFLKSGYILIQSLVVALDWSLFFCLLVLVLSGFNLNVFSDKDDISLLGFTPFGFAPFC